MELGGRYRLEKLLGRGGMGQVWLGFDQNLRRPVAVKLLLAELLGDDRVAGQVLARFRREGEAAARLSHRNIAAVYDLGERREDGDGGARTSPFLVLEYLEGSDLRTLLDERHPGGMPAEDVLDYGIQAGEGLAAAHGSGVVHRDVKPANLMLLADGTVKVCDFGIARIQDVTAGLTRTGFQPGTLAYMPPEQLDGKRVDHRADLYALGATLYHLLTGRHVFSADSQPALINMIFSREPVPPGSLRSGVMPGLDALLLSLLAKDPDRRPPDAAGVVRSLRALTREGAEQDVQERRREAERELTRARRQAEQIRLEAERELRQAREQALQIRAEAEAEAVQMIGKARFEAERIRATARQNADGAPFSEPANTSIPPTVSLEEVIDGFDIVLRGYDRYQVEGYLRRLFDREPPPSKAPAIDVVLRGFDRLQVDEFFTNHGYPAPD